MLTLNGQFHTNPRLLGGDKSITHRALILASVADGVCVIRNASVCEDTVATMNCLRTLGADVKVEGSTVTVHPIVQPRNSVTLDARNSGTTARLVAGLLCGLNVSAQVVGDSALSKRPMDRVINPLTAMGGKFVTNDGLYSTAQCQLHNVTITQNVPSAQVKSAVLIAGMLGDGVSYVEPVATRDHTERLMSCVGVDVTKCGNVITVGKSTVKHFDITVPVDTSTAMYHVALAVATNTTTVIPNVCVNPTRTGMIDVLNKCGAHISYNNYHISCGEPVADIVVDKGAVGNIECCEQDTVNAIDDVLALSVVALANKGVHTLRGVEELQLKESNRIDAIIHFATVCNQQASFDGHNIVITSNGVLPNNVAVHTKGDHRTALAGSVLALCCGGGSVDNPCFDVSASEFLPSLGIRPYNFALIGSNVSDSKSPLLMNHLATKSRLNVSYTAVSLPSDVTDNKLTEIMNSYDGLNVTMPFKRRVASLTNAQVPSVNTVGTTKPCSTDGYGILRSLERHNVDLCGKPVWVIGAGGASTVAVECLTQLGAQVGIINRTQSNADVLNKRYNLNKPSSKPYAVFVFVPTCSFEQNLVLPESVELVFNGNYRGTSGLTDKAMQRGVTVISGLEMLYHQGAKSFALWTGTEVQDNYDEFCKVVKL